MITYGLVKQVGPYSKNEPSSYSSTANNVVVMSPRYPYDPVGESTSIHQRSLWASRLVSDAANLEDPKTSLQYARAQQQKENISITLGNLFGNTFTTTSETQQQQPPASSMGSSASRFLLQGLEALNYILRTQRTALREGVTSPAWSDYTSSPPGLAPVTPQPFAVFSPYSPSVYATPDGDSTSVYATPNGDSPSVYGTPDGGTPDIAWAEKILSAGLAAMDLQLADQISDAKLKEEIKTDVTDIWSAFRQVGDLNVGTQIARDRLENVLSEIDTTVANKRQVQQAIMVAQSPVSVMAPKTSMLNQSLETAGLPTTGEVLTIAPNRPLNPAEVAFDLLLERLNRMHRAMEDAQLKELYEKEILPNMYDAERKMVEDLMVNQKISEMPDVPSKDPTEIAMENMNVPSVEDLTLLRSGRESRDKKKQITGPYQPALQKIRNTIQKYGVWKTNQRLRFMNPGVWTPDQGIQYVDSRGTKRVTNTEQTGSKRAKSQPRGTKRGKKTESLQEPKRTRSNSPEPPAPSRRVLQRPPPINTNVPRVRSEQVRKRNIEKSMEEFIPQRRSRRNR